MAEWLAGNGEREGECGGMQRLSGSQGGNGARDFVPGKLGQPFLRRCVRRM